MLDHLSGGRLELGVGRGVSPFELAYYGVSFMDSREIFEEALTVLVKGLRDERLQHRGKHYRFDNVPMEIRPQQRPNPPFWYGVTSPESLMFAARHGMHMVGGGPNAVLKPMTAQFREEVARHRGNPEDLNPGAGEPIIGALRHIYVAADEREVETIAAPAYRVFYDNITKLWRDFRTLPDYGFTPELTIARQADVAIRHGGTGARLDRPVLRVDRLQLSGDCLRVGRAQSGRFDEVARAFRHPGDAAVSQLRAARAQIPGREALGPQLLSAYAAQMMWASRARRGSCRHLSGWVRLR